MVAPTVPLPFSVGLVLIGPVSAWAYVLGTHLGVIVHQDCSVHHRSENWWNNSD